MNPPSRVTAVSISRGGLAESNAVNEAPATIFPEALQVHGLSVADLATLEWTNVPASDAGVLAQALARQHQASMGEAEATLFTASCAHLMALFARLGVPEFSIGAAWTGSPARIDLTLTRTPEDPNPTAQAPETTFTLDVPQDANADDIRQALSEVGERPPAHLAFDPLTQLPADQAGRLVHDIAQGVGAQADGLDVLLAASSVLLVWQRLERLNAETLHLALNGLADAEGPIADGETLAVRAVRQGLDPETPTLSASHGEPMVEARVRMRAH